MARTSEEQEQLREKKKAKQIYDKIMNDPIESLPVADQHTIIYLLLKEKRFQEAVELIDK